MGVIASLALLRVHVLVLELPGRPLLRLRAEAAVRARGWVLTTAPEDTDLVLVCGTPSAGVAEAVDALWARVPLPRARRTVQDADALPDALDSALDSAARVLADDALQRRAAEQAAPPPPPPPAERLGPLRADWPAGLVVEYALDPDGLVAAAGTRRLRGEADQDGLPELRPFLTAVADAARLLRLAGWAVPAMRLDRVVDLAIAGRPTASLTGRLRRVAGSVRRSGTLRWTLRRQVAAVDVHARVLALLAAAIDGSAPPPPVPRRLIGQPGTALPLLVAATEPTVRDG